MTLDARTTGLQDPIFCKAVQFVFQSEGGTNYSSQDRGGLTNYGISKKQYPHLDIAELTKNDALKIYYTDYWLHTKCYTMQKPLAIAIFDTAVNCGNHSVGVWLQKSINNTKPMTLPLLVVDGIIGSKTIRTLERCNQNCVLLKLIAHRLNRYTRLTAKDPTQKIFIIGWISRVSNMLRIL